MHRVNRKIAVLLYGVALFLSNQLFSQTTIWSEDFSGYLDGTTTGANNNTENPANDWTTDRSALSLGLTDNFDVTGGVFTINDTDGEGVWTSEVIDISSYTGVSVTVDLFDDVGNNANGADYLRVYYVYNGVTNFFPTNGNNSGTFGASIQASVTGLDGTVGAGTLQIIITGYNNQNDETFTFDNVEVTGTFVPHITLEPCIFEFNKTIIVDSDNVPSDLTDFPLLVSFTADADLQAHIHSANGYDVAFYDPATCIFFDYQLESYDNTTGDYVAWVKIPTLSSSVDTEIRMLYGNRNITTDLSDNGVWDSDFSAVYHFNGVYTDASASGVNGTNNGSTVVPAKIGNGGNFDGTNDYIAITNITDNDFTASAWIYPDVSGANACNNAYCGSGILWSDVGGCDDDIIPLVFRNNRFSFGTGGGCNYDELRNGGVALNVQEWYHVTVTRNSATGAKEIFINGASSNTSTGETGTMDGNPVLAIGGNTLDNRFFDGLIDEMHFSSIIRSDDWIATEYANQSDPTAFYTVRAEQYACDTVYSIQSGNWSTEGNWSLSSGGCSCVCTPKGTDSTSVIIEGNDVISLTAADEVHKLIIGTSTGAGSGAGTLQWNGGFDLDFYGDDGCIDIRSNGSLNRNGNAGWSLDFDNTSGANYTWNNDGYADIHEFDIGDATLTISGSADIRVRDDVNFRADNSVITNNNTAEVSVEDDFDFNNFTATINNNGTFDIDGGFTDVQAGEVIYYNFAGSVTNFAGLANDTDTDMQIDADYDSNTFEYDRNGETQRIIVSHGYWNLTLSNSGNKNIDDDVLDINGDLSIEDDAQFNADDAGDDITIAGNWINTSSLDFDSGTQSVTFDGTTDQSITNPGGETFHDLIIGNNGNTVNMLNDVSLTNTGVLSFSTNGYLALNTNDLTIPAWSAGDITGYGDQAFIIVDQTGYIKTNGVVILETVTFPMGLVKGSGNLAVAEITNYDVFNTTFDANLCNYVSKQGGCSGGTQVTEDVVGYTYNLVSGSTSADVNLIWHSSKETTNFDRTLCRVMHHNTTIWEEIANWGAGVDESGIFGAGYYSSSGTTTGFSPFTVEDNNIPLPVELISFKADVIEHHSLLTWYTASEENNSHFIVQRSKDGLSGWENIGRVEGSGNSTDLIAYHYTDLAPLKGHNYYRLIQVDYDGTEALTPMDWVLFNVEDQLDYVIFPNPTNSELNIQFQHEYDGDIAIQLMDMKGRILKTIDKTHILSEKINMEGLPQATYILKIIYENKVFVEKVVKH